MTLSATVDAFFRTATRGQTPYGYRRRLAGDTAGRACDSLLINTPTGLGQTGS